MFRGAVRKTGKNQGDPLAPALRFREKHARTRAACPHRVSSFEGGGEHIARQAGAPNPSRTGVNNGRVDHGIYFDNPPKPFLSTGDATGLFHEEEEDCEKRPSEASVGRTQSLCLQGEADNACREKKGPETDPRGERSNVRRLSVPSYAVGFDHTLFGFSQSRG